MGKNNNNNMNEIYSVIKENINSQFSSHTNLKMVIVYYNFFDRILKDMDIEILAFDKVQLDLNYSCLIEKYKRILEWLHMNFKRNMLNKKILKEIIILFLTVYNCYLEDNKRHRLISDVENYDDNFEDSDNIGKVKEFIRKRLNLN